MQISSAEKMDETKKASALAKAGNKARKSKRHEEWDQGGLVERLLDACSYKRRLERHERAERDRRDRAREEALAANRRAWATEFQLHPLTLVYTTETSGLSSNENTILRLAWKLYDSHNDWKAVEECDILVRWPEDETCVTDGAIEVNGLSKEYLEAHGAVPLEEAMSLFAAAWIRADRVAAMFPDFHEAFVRKAFEECGIEVPTRPHYSSGVRSIYDEGDSYTESKIMTEALMMRWSIETGSNPLLAFRLA